MTPDNQPALPEDVNSALHMLWKLSEHDAQAVRSYIHNLESLRRAEGATLSHKANEWADMATNGIQWLRNIRDGISTPADALAEMESNYLRIQSLAEGATLSEDELASWRELADHVRTGVPIWPDRYTDSRTRDVAQFIRDHSEGATLGEGRGLIDWTKDAYGWGGALNSAAWAFIDACPEKSALLFNNTKPALRAAILKYAAAISSAQRVAEGDGPKLHFATQQLVERFSVALAEKLAVAEAKYGYSDGWRDPNWMDECRAKLMEHIAKGDPRDVAAYCAFLWFHDAPTAIATPPPTGEAVAWQFFDNDDMEWRMTAHPAACMKHGHKVRALYTHPAAQADGMSITEALIDKAMNAHAGYMAVGSMKIEPQSVRERNAMRAALSAAITAVHGQAEPAPRVTDSMVERLAKYIYEQEARKCSTLGAYNQHLRNWPRALPEARAMLEVALAAPADVGGES